MYFQYEELKARLKTKSVIAGVGNSLKGDDGAGPFFIARMRKTTAPFVLIDTGSSPENWSGKIEKEKPDTIMVVDVADFGAVPAEAKIFEIEELEEKGFTTHSMNIRFWMKYLKDTTKADVFLLAIQPKKIGFSEEISPEIKECIEKIVQAIAK